MKKLIKILIPSLLLLIVQSIFADGAFQTGSAEPVEYKHFEFYLFSTLDKDDEAKNFQAPALEIDWGALPNFEVDLTIPYLSYQPNEGENIWGIGDMETALKYRFIQETDHIPEVAFAPSFDWPTGKNNYNLGDGKSLLKLPFWLQKQLGNLNISAGGGYALSPEPDTKNYPFFGCLLQRNLNDKFSIGSEIFFQGADSDDSESTAILNVGASYNVARNFSLLFSIGQSIFGKKHIIGYIGLHYIL